MARYGRYTKNMNEIWRDVKGQEGRYQASNLGRVRSIMKKEPYVLSESILSDGYARVGLFINGKTKTIRTHRIIATTFIDKPCDNLQVNHKDGDKLNNHVDNLEWVTPKENTRHAWRNNLCGDRHGNKSNQKALSNEQKIAISSSDKTTKELAREYNVGIRTIQKLRRR